MGPTSGAPPPPATVDRPAPLDVGAPTVEPTSDGWRVSWEVDGDLLWIASPDVQLAGPTAAVAAALWVPALALGRDLRLRGDVAPVEAGASAIAELAGRWWGYGPVALLGDPSAAPGVDDSTGTVGDSGPRRTALCFSGGIDSLHTLLASGEQVDVLVLVHGFDIDLDDTWRWGRAEAHALEVAASTGTELVRVVTNFRRHPVAGSAPWQWSHGGALAAVGHVLAPAVDRLLVSSSFPYAQPRPWGSSWLLEPHWSTDGLRVEHVGAELWGDEKLTRLAHHPLVLRHARVCHQHLVPDLLNCGRCEKCTRRMLVLAVEGTLGQATAFPPTTLAELAASIDELPGLPGDGVGTAHRHKLQSGLPAPLYAAVRRLLERSGQPVDEGATGSRLPEVAAP